MSRTVVILGLDWELSGDMGGEFIPLVLNSLTLGALAGALKNNTNCDVVSIESNKVLRDHHTRKKHVGEGDYLRSILYVVEKQDPDFLCLTVLSCDILHA